MKKGIIVLLIAVLVAGFAFADGTAGEAKFSGSATISYDYNLDSKETGIVNAQAMKYNFTFSFNSTDGASKGEGKLYAEIAANAKIELVADDQEATGYLTPKATLKISKANIVAGDITIDILGPKGFYSFASFYAEDADGDPAMDKADEDTLKGLGLNTHGLRILYKDFEFSFAFWHATTAAVAEKDPTAIIGVPYFAVEDDLDPDLEDITYFIMGGPIAVGDDEYYLVADLNGVAGSAASDSTKLYAGFKTPAFKLADGLTLTAGGNAYFLFDAYTVAGGGLAIKYAPEDSKISASFGYDVEALIAKNADNVVLPMEFSASATYDFVSAYLYFVTIDKFDSTFDFLAAKVEADYDVNDSVNVGGYAEILYLEIIGNGSPEFRFGANATYTAESFKVKATVDVAISKVGDEYKLRKGVYFDGTKYPGLGFTVDLSSTKVIDNATVGIKWTGSDFSKKANDDPEALGKISAYCKVAF